jgi:HNH endonuclease
MPQLTLKPHAVLRFDAIDAALVQSIGWHAHDSGDRYYARGRVAGQRVYLHRLLLDAPRGLEVDHINGNGLDNRRCNLRLVSRSRNQLNRKDVRGIWQQRTKWRAAVSVDGVRYHAGCFASAAAARRAYLDLKGRLLCS